MKNILVVCPDPRFRETLVSFLQETFPIDQINFCNGLKGIERMKKNAINCAIVDDVTEKGTSILKIFSALRSNSPEVKICFISLEQFSIDAIKGADCTCLKDKIFSNLGDIIEEALFFKKVE